MGQFSQSLWAKESIKHFDQYLGKHVSVDTFNIINTSSNINIIAYDNVFDGCRAFCSAGFSEFTKVVGKTAEVFMPIDDGWDFTPSILAGVLTHIIQNNMKMGWGLSIEFADVFPEFVKEYQKAAIYFSTPFGVPEGFENIPYANDKVTVYLACYITENENKWFTNHGAKAFEKLLHDNQVDVFHIYRQSCI